MSIRLSITIPDELQERLQKVKDNLNVSKICTARIEQAVKIEEMKLIENPDFEKFTNRIREEIKIDREKEKELGFEHGLVDALELPYEEYKTFMGSYHQLMEYSKDESEFSYDLVHELFYDYAPTNRVDRMERQNRIGYAYEIGWIYAIAETYQKAMQVIYKKEDSSVDD